MRQKAPWSAWRNAFSRGSQLDMLSRLYGEDQSEVWNERYTHALDAYQQTYGGEAEVVIARCPAQMNLMGMHLDYGGMPSLRLAVRGADIITIASSAAGSSTADRVRLRSLVDGAAGDPDRFGAVQFGLSDLGADEDVSLRSAFMEYASRLCAERERETGNSMASSWQVLPQGQMIYLQSYFRGRHEIAGFDGLIWSNVPSSGGMSSSSALVVSTAYAALGVNDLHPGLDMPVEILVDGVGTSEWLRGTRGGTADHGGMIMGKLGELVSVGVFPARDRGRATLPDDYAAISFDSGVPRVYDDTAKDETAIAYPLGVFALRELILPALAGSCGYDRLVRDYRERLDLVRDVTAEVLGLKPGQLFDLLTHLPQHTSMREVERWAVRDGKGAAFSSFVSDQVGDRYPHVSGDHPIKLRRRFAFALAEHDRVHAMLEFMKCGEMERALELIRTSHAGERDQEVADEQLAQHQRGLDSGDERWRLCFLSGGYGRMTPEYDRVVEVANECLSDIAGPAGGAVQRLGAGWGGAVGGLVRRDLTTGDKGDEFAAHIHRELGLELDLHSRIATPGEGASLLAAPA